jgi:hypothetical protein
MLGVGLFLLTWWVILLDGASHEAVFIGRIYRGYAITPLGSIFGLIWGFVDGLIVGAIFAWLYNMFSIRSTAVETG